jgi:hypothetical protein
VVTEGGELPKRMEKSGSKGPCMKEKGIEGGREGGRYLHHVVHDFFRMQWLHHVGDKLWVGIGLAYFRV